MKAYTIFFIIVPILDLLLDYIEGKYSLKITDAEEMSESLIYRMRYARMRLWISTILMVGGFAFTIAVDGVEGAKYSPFLAGWWMVKRKRLMKHQNPVSWKTLEDVKSQDFILYLRGFSSDSYSDINEADKFKSDKFNEYKFIKILNYYYPVYAVGMTKELYSPHGASRIYLRDETWETDVQTLIEKSKMVVILLNSSESCIKEIIHCTPHSDKTLYIIDDINKFKTVKDYCRKNNIYSSLPLLLPRDGLYSFYSNKDGKFLTPMSNSANSYAKHICEYMSLNMGCKRKLHNFGIKFLALMTATFICYLFLSNILAFPEAINFAFYITWTGMLILYLFHELPYRATHGIWNVINKIPKVSQSL